MMDTIVGVLGLAPPKTAVRLPNEAVLRSADKGEFQYYLGLEGTTPIAINAWFENALIFIPAQDTPTTTVLSRLEGILQLSVDAAIGLWGARDSQIVIQPHGVNVGFFHYDIDNHSSYCSAPSPDEKTVKHFTDLWDILDSQANDDTAQRIRRGMRRYQRSLEENDEEAIFHLVAACEAVACPEHKEARRQSRFVNRVSKIVSDHASQRNKIKRSLKAFWGCRSGFAHGSQSSYCDHVNILRSYTHRVICKAFEQPTKFDVSVVANLG